MQYSNKIILHNSVIFFSVNGLNTVVNMLMEKLADL